MSQPLTDAKVKLVGQDGKAFVIIVRVRSAIKKSNRPELAQPFVDEVMSGDYDNLLQTCMKYVEVL